MAVETPMVTKFLRERPDDSWQYETARAYNNAYTRIEKAFAMGSEAIVQEVQKSGLRGKGGAGFGAGQKWSFLPKDVFPRYLCVNGDEGEPATFKDHMIVERDPHQLVEGVIITAFAIQANHAFIYLRGEVTHVHRRLLRARGPRPNKRGSRRRTEPCNEFAPFHSISGCALLRQHPVADEDLGLGKIRPEAGDGGFGLCQRRPGNEAEGRGQHNAKPCKNPRHFNSP